MSLDHTAQQLSLLEGLLLAEAGIAQAIDSRTELIEAVRVGIIKIALKRENRCATADDADVVLSDLCCTHRDLGNAAGGIFRDGNWRNTGEWKPSVRTTNHARHVRVWQLK
jgi:hypothetical protein